MWKTVEDEADEARMTKTEEREDVERKKKKFRKLTVEKEIEITRIIEKKQEEKDLIKIRTVEKMVSRWFHKYLKMFEKKKLERILMRKIWDHAIDFRKGFVLKKGKIYLLSRIEREEVHEFVKNQLRKRYI